MPYSKFTSLAKFCHDYALKNSAAKSLFKDSGFLPVAPSRRLLDDMEDSKQFPLYSEKAKSEMLIAPVLKEVKRNNPSLSLFSGFALNIEGNTDLSGFPDFVLSAKPDSVEIEAPVFCLVESKNKAPDEGFAQCAAEMYAARLLNQQMKEPYETIYGAVTNAYDWVFLKLEGDTVFIDRERYYLNELPKILGIFQYIIDQYKP